ncbi:hypothetical protein NC652_025038 [Populus alba x Populus x berolinensis]|nr:hypothetical protein NC652_025038 [Populus alba x Populus x berolinensis]
MRLRCAWGPAFIARCGIMAFHFKISVPAETMYVTYFHCIKASRSGRLPAVDFIELSMSMYFRRSYSSRFSVSFVPVMEGGFYSSDNSIHMAFRQGLGHNFGRVAFLIN